MVGRSQVGVRSSMRFAVWDAGWKLRGFGVKIKVVGTKNAGMVITVDSGESGVSLFFKINAPSRRTSNSDTKMFDH